MPYERILATQASDLWWRNCLRPFPEWKALWQHNYQYWNEGKLITCDSRGNDTRELNFHPWSRGKIFICSQKITQLIVYTLTLMHRKYHYIILNVSRFWSVIITFAVKKIPLPNSSRQPNVTSHESYFKHFKVGWMQKEYVISELNGRHMLLSERKQAFQREF
jgi:hypothetical protein